MRRMESGRRLLAVHTMFFGAMILLFLSTSVSAFIARNANIPLDRRRIIRRTRQYSAQAERFYMRNVNSSPVTRPSNPNPPPPRPYIIERIADCPDENVYSEIADMCIDVFFKEQLNAGPQDRLPPWKEAQISYLKTLQTGDLRRRRERYSMTNEMFLAFAAEPALSQTTNGTAKRRLITDNAEIQNLPAYLSDQLFVRGDLLGFVEITQRQYGLGIGGRYGEDGEIRPVLTNLAVSRKARTLGIGSQLLDRCERHVVRNWRMGEIVLEVEDYNTQAVDFYVKRGYDVLFADPARRRFDVSGLVLRKVRCTRQILRKNLTWLIAQQASEQAVGLGWFSQFVPGGGNYF